MYRGIVGGTIFSMASPRHSTRAAIVLVAISVVVVVPAMAGELSIRLALKQPRVGPVLAEVPRFALVIGVSNYQYPWPYLPRPNQDVCRVQEALQKHGFHVEVLSDCPLGRVGCCRTNSAGAPAHDVAPCE